MEGRNNDINLYFQQLKQFLISNFILYKNLTKEKIESSDAVFSKDLFYEVSYDDIRNWKTNIGYKEICEKINLKNIKKEEEILKTNEDEKIAKDNIKMNIEMAVQNRKDIISNFDEIRNSSTNSNNINSSLDFYYNFSLFSCKEWNLFNGKKDENQNKNLLVIIGKRKIIIKRSKSIFHVFTINDDLTDIKWYEIENHIRKLNINIVQGDSDVFVKKLIGLDIINLYNQNLNQKIVEISPENITIKLIEIQRDNDNNWSLSSIKHPENENISISDINITNLKLRDLEQTKIQIPSFISSVLFSLMKNKKLAEYLLNLNDTLILVNRNELLIQLKKFYEIMWKVRDNFNEFNQADFMKILEKNFSNLYENINDKELCKIIYSPINFMKKLLSFIHVESSNIYQDANNVYKNNLSIITEIFGGNFEEKGKCKKCNREEIKIVPFQYFEFDMNAFQNHNISNNKFTCLVNIKDIFQFYFSEKEVGKNPFKCEICGTSIIPEYKKIDEFPENLIILLNYKGNTIERNEIILKEEIILYSKNKQEKIYKINGIIMYVKTVEEPEFRFYTFSDYDSNQELRKNNIPIILFLDKI